MSAQLPKVPGGLLPQTSTRLPLWIALGLALLMLGGGSAVPVWRWTRRWMV
ncbi:hypothetical protein [Alicyclobacillus acidocaldarius]|uniref:hypothetical protein n=1 Tax=Alicyclobacillus acidocaldarius TaxID=405212 RepID=UPI001873151A|nr:hypothetical protein [Alicyclobacillus acidocaldarius]